MMEWPGTVRGWIGTGVAFAAALPWVWKSDMMIYMLAYDGVHHGMGAFAKVQINYLFDIVAFIVSALLFALSRLLLHRWHVLALVFASGMMILAATQDIRLAISAVNIATCGAADCDMPKSSNFPAPEVKTFK